jgi:hypothetical protein
MLQINEVREAKKRELRAESAWHCNSANSSAFMIGEVDSSPPTTVWPHNQIHPVVWFLGDVIAANPPLKDDRQRFSLET